LHIFVGHQRALLLLRSHDSPKTIGEGSLGPSFGGMIIG
jgi:hypothetical protein